MTLFSSNNPRQQGHTTKSGKILSKESICIYINHYYWSSLLSNNLPRYIGAQKYMNNAETFLDIFDKVCRKISMKILMSKHLFKNWDAKWFDIANERRDLKSER